MGCFLTVERAIQGNIILFTLANLSGNSNAAESDH